MHFQELVVVEDTQVLGKDVLPDKNREIESIMQNFYIFVFFHFDNGAAVDSPASFLGGRCLNIGRFSCRGSLIRRN